MKLIETPNGQKLDIFGHFSESTMRADGTDVSQYTAMGIDAAAAASCLAANIPPNVCALGAQAINTATGPKDSGDITLDKACGKVPGAFASASAWKNYSTCKANYNQELINISSSWPTQSEFPRSAWDALIANSSPSASSLQDALALAKTLVTEYQRQTDYHLNTDTSKTHLDDAKITTRWRDTAQSYVTALGQKLTGATTSPPSNTNPNPPTNNPPGNNPPSNNPATTSRTFGQWMGTTTGMIVTTGTVLLLVGTTYYGYKHGWFGKK